MHIDRVTSYLNSINSCSWIFVPNIPKLDGIVPYTTVVELIRIRVEFDSLNFAVVKMIHTFILGQALLRFVIINFNLWLVTSNYESRASFWIIKSRIFISSIELCIFGLYCSVWRCPLNDATLLLCSNQSPLCMIWTLCFIPTQLFYWRYYTFLHIVHLEFEHSISMPRTYYLNWSLSIRERYQGAIRCKWPWQDLLTLIWPSFEKLTEFEFLC